MTTIRNLAPTGYQKKALRWLHEHNGSGLISSKGDLFCSGERAPFMRDSWLALQAIGFVTIGFRRIGITRRGRDFVLAEGNSA